MTAESPMETTVEFKTEGHVINDVTIDDVTTDDVMMKGVYDDVTETYFEDYQGKITWLLTFTFYYKLLITILGCCGNILSIYVLAKTKAAVTTRILLSLLAFSDTCYLVISLPFMIAVFYFNTHFDWLNQVACKIVTFKDFFFTAMSYWLVAILTVERCIAVTQPLQFKILVTKKRLLVFLTCFLVVYLVWQGFLLYIFKLTDLFDEEGNYMMTICVTFEYLYIVQIMNPIIDAAMPMLLVVMGNISICVAILVYERKSPVLHSNTTHNKGTDSKLFLTTFSVSVSFVILTTPFYLYYTVGEYFLGEEVFVNPNNEFYLISDILYHTNLATNFGLYVTFNESFRQQVKLTFQGAQTVC